MITGYAKQITDEYNEWAEKYQKAIEGNGKSWDLEAMSVAAFMCNAINLAMTKSSNKNAKEYFQAHAVTD